MRFALALLSVGALLSGCATLPLPVGSGIPATCAERLTESSCREGTRCRWIGDFKRADGTYATAHCSEE
jgi:hypothetical protein